ncbi:ATP-dependent zinc metalloprotease FtsH [Magnetospirillum sp. UT-4]|uniref:ATP-dependent zinc metalloprotease FtsH n=1 Tax=Magnetospirillum sp. UT-4 TaxID=2681467 RepID=UPI00137D5B9E|nr:ATP-dependent zinc metalloprotease FtsH [Magnetospirillum sp. UT-4]CAA7622590.1 ATP-dependent zinc metalloprotease FtsH [Magnetospirillum sp. UT-4]
MSKRKKYLLAALLAVLGLTLAGAASYPLYRALARPAAPAAAEAGYSGLRKLVEGGTAAELTFYARGTAVLRETSGALHRAQVPAQVAAGLAAEAAGKGAAVSFALERDAQGESHPTSETLLAVGGNVLIVAAIIGAVVFFRLRGGMAGGNRARRAGASESNVRFADVAGCDNEKAELMEVVEFLKDPRRFSRLGARVPTGVLMSGPPGTGKTLLARAVAGEAGVPFFSISGSDFVEMFVGVGAGRVRKMFATAKKKAPCILFIDEIDAVGRQRSGSNARAAHEEREQTLNQLLVEMDGFKPNSGVVVIAATNRPDILDEALLRPGRFSRHVVLQIPDVSGREKILGVHAGSVRLAAEVDLHAVARGTPGFSGAQLMHLVNEAAILAARAGREGVGAADFDQAKDRILLGTERAVLFAEEDRRLTAYHEAGHAVVALHQPASDPIHKATIVPRGQALGMVVRIPERDSPALRRSKLKADIAVAMGGRAAEELVFGPEEISTGAAGDIQMASRIARKMVTEWGMSDRLGLVAFGGAHGDPYTPEGVRADETSREIDAEVKALVAEGRMKALAILKTHSAQLEAVAQALLDRESLSGAEITEITRGAGFDDLDQAAFREL